MMVPEVTAARRDGPEPGQPAGDDRGEPPPAAAASGRGAKAVRSPSTGVRP